MFKLHFAETQVVQGGILIKMLDENRMKCGIIH